MRHTMKGIIVRKFSGDVSREVDLEITIEVEALMLSLAVKATCNKSRKTKIAGGLIVLKATP